MGRKSEWFTRLQVGARANPQAGSSPPPPLLIFLALILLCSFLFFYRLGDRSLSSSHEARAAQNAQSILDNNQWLLPQLFDRQVELQKPPLYYWLVAWLTQLRGGRVDGWTVRLPAALAALGTVLVVFWLCAARGRAWAGLLSVAVLATCIHFTWLARVGRIDMPLTFTITLTVAAFYLGHCRRSDQGKAAWPWFAVGYAAMGLGLLLKGPIAVVLPAAVLLPLGAVACGFAKLHRFGLWWGVPLTLGIALPWYVLANQATGGDLFQTFFWYHNVARGLGGAEELAGNPWWFYGLRLSMDLLPWSLLLLPVSWSFVRGKVWRTDALAGLGLLWLLMITVLLSCLHFKRADYLLPAYPGAALFFGCMLERWCPSLTLPARSASLAFRVGMVLLLAGCVVGWWYYIDRVIPVQDALLTEQRLAEEIRRRTKEPVVFFRVEAHELAFHAGPPMATVLEWENLDVWAAQAKPYYVVMPTAEAEQWRQHLGTGRLEEILHSEHLTAAPVDRPLVLLRTKPMRKKDD